MDDSPEYAASKRPTTAPKPSSGLHWKLAALLLVMPATIGLVAITMPDNQAAAAPRNDGQSQLSSLPRAFEFVDDPNTVSVKGSMWIFVVPSGGATSMGPGASIRCSKDSGSCVLVQYFDGGATNTTTTYEITHWGIGQIEAENGHVNIADKHLSEGYRESLAAECLIVNRAKEQAFKVRKQTGQTCRQLDKLLDEGTLLPGEQLCARGTGPRPSYECPNPLRIVQ
jgi:hypothetical protein